MLTIHLAMPPSTNAIWRSTVGKHGKPRVYRAKAYAAWMHTAAWTVKTAVIKSGQIKGDVRVTVHFWPRQGDLDNRLKAVCDSLVQGGAIEDDSKIVDLRAVWNNWDGVPSPAYVMVEAA